MKVINNKLIPYFTSEISYSNYLDYLSSEKKDIKTLIGIGLDFIQSDFVRQKTINDIVKNCKDYQPEINNNYVHNNELYIYKPLHELTLLEGVLSMNYAKEYAKPQYKANNVGLFATKLYLMATLSRKVVSNKLESLPTNLGLTFEFIENRVNELKDISVKNVVDFEYYYHTFEKKLEVPLYYRAFKSLHPINTKNTDFEAKERHQRFTDFYGGFGIYEHLKTNGLIQDLNTPFFDALYKFGLSVNK